MKVKGSGIPPEKVFYLAEKQSYSNTPLPNLDEYKLVVSTPTLKAYIKDKELLIAIRGTKVTDKEDLSADASIPLNKLKESSRYKKDKAVVEQIVKKYPPQDYEYYLAGHSLGGAIANQLKYDFPFIRNSVQYNPAFQPKDLIYSQGDDIKRLYVENDPLYNLGGRLFVKNVKVLPKRSLVGQTLIDSISGHLMSSFADLYNATGGNKGDSVETLRKKLGHIKRQRKELKQLLAEQEDAGEDEGAIQTIIQLDERKRRYQQLKKELLERGGADGGMENEPIRRVRAVIPQHLRPPRIIIPPPVAPPPTPRPMTPRPETTTTTQKPKRKDTFGEGGSKPAGFVKMLYAKRVLKRKPDYYPTRDKKAPKKFEVSKIGRPSKHLQKKFAFETTQKVQIPTLNRPFKKGERKHLTPEQLAELRKIELVRKHKSLAKKEGITLEEFYRRHPKSKK